MKNYHIHDEKSRRSGSANNNSANGGATADRSTSVGAVVEEPRMHHSGASQDFFARTPHSPEGPPTTTSSPHLLATTHSPSAAATMRDRNFVVEEMSNHFSSAGGGAPSLISETQTRRLSQYKSVQQPQSSMSERCQSWEGELVDAALSVSHAEEFPPPSILESSTPPVSSPRPTIAMHHTSSNSTAPPPALSTPSSATPSVAFVGCGGSPDNNVKISKRALHLIQRVDEVIRRCQGDTTERPTSEELMMFEVFTRLKSCPIGLLFVSHPEISLSNRSCVLTTPELNTMDAIEGHVVRGAYSSGTVGRSFFAQKDALDRRSTAGSSVGVSTPTTAGDIGQLGSSLPLSRTSRGTATRKDFSRDSPSTQGSDPSLRIMKVVSFALRRALLDSVVAEQCVLINLNQETILKVHDVLSDECKENLIVISQYHTKGNICRYAGNLDNETEKLRYILFEVAMGLRVLHSHKIYHHNIKLDNVLETADGHFCIADAGFSWLFTCQCPEALVFNGELASLPPEVFDEGWIYANDDVDASTLAHPMESTTQLRRSGNSSVRYVGENASQLSARAQSSSSQGQPTSSASQPSRTMRSVQPNHSRTAMVDVWGLGVLMYRLAYGRDPIEIAEEAYEDVRDKILTFELQFPPRCWPFTADLEDAISWCMEKDPERRPTILKLLRHPFFKECLQTFPRNSVLSGSFTGIRARSANNRTSSFYSRRTPINGYFLKHLIGSGRWCDTFLASSRGHNGPVVYKVLTRSILRRFEELHSDRARKEKRRQLVVCQKLRSPYLASMLDIFDVGKDGCGVVVEHFRGGSLREMPPIASTSTDAAHKNMSNEMHVALPCAQTLQHLLRCVLCGLAVLHDNGIAHLSVSPSNIFFCDETQTYKLADFGPAFLSVDEIKHSVDVGKPIFSLPARITEGRPRINGVHVDIFCVGLLAATIVPSLSRTLWRQLECAPGYAPINPQEIISTVAENSRELSLPPTLIDFITDALTRKVDARRLLRSPFLHSEDGIVEEIGVSDLPASPSEIEEVLIPQVVEEHRMLDVIGQDPFAESHMISTTLDAMMDGPPAVVPCVSFKYRGKLECVVCHMSIVIVFYQCPTCCDMIKCGKCALVDHHAEGHHLDAYIIRTVEHHRDGSKCAKLVVPSQFQDVHVLELIEMKANLPSRTLYAHDATRSPVTRSTSPSISKVRSDINFVQLDEADSSISTIDGRSATNLKAFSSLTAFNGLSSGTCDDNSNKKLAKPAKKTVLPKAEDLDQVTWQQELERCRESFSSELLLYSFGFEEVPMEVYNPPLLHVVVLDLSQNMLTELPSELSFLVYLRKLTVSYNQLHELPDSLGNLRDLENLDASHNLLTDLPATFSFLVHLEIISLDYNDFTTVPSAMLEIMAPPTRTRLTNTSNLHESIMSEAGGNPKGTTTEESNAEFLMTPTHNFSDEYTGTSNSNGDSCGTSNSPRLNVIYLAANDHLTTFPSVEQLRRFASLTIALDNEPSIYRHYEHQRLATKLPNVTVNWNKIYPDEIVANLFCGSLRSAQSQMVYERLGIQYLLTVGRQLTPVPPKGGKHRVIVVDDIPGADILSSLQEAVEFIDESHRRGVGCLVHCFAGLSRSATTVIGYLMIQKHMRLDDAYLLAKKGRPAILPNKGFFEQLVQLDAKLFPNDRRPLNVAALERPE